VIATATAPTPLEELLEVSEEDELVDRLDVDELEEVSEEELLVDRLDVDELDVEELDEVSEEDELLDSSSISGASSKIMLICASSLLPRVSTLIRTRKSVKSVMAETSPESNAMVSVAQPPRVNDTAGHSVARRFAPSYSIASSFSGLPPPPTTRSRR